MRKASWAIALLVLVSTLHITITIVPESVRGATLYVGGTGPGNYTTIQGAIDAAMPGDNIHVFSGTYRENVEIYKTVSLIGESRDNTIINGTQTGDAFNITADWVNLTGFTAEYGSGGGWPTAGVELSHANECNVSHNRFHHNHDGIVLWDSNNNTLTDNIYTGNEAGIYLRRSNGNTMSNNNISDHYLFGLVLEESSSNSFSSNKVLVEYDAIAIWGSDRNTLADNLVHSNRSAGISVSGSENNTMAYNSITASSYGFSIRSSYNNALTNNTVSTSRSDSIYLHSSSGITLSNNTLISSGIFMEGSLEHWNTHDIDSSNTVDGRPVYYWKDAVGGSIPLGAGQIILANCTGVIAENQNLKNGSVGFLIGYSHYNTIANSSSTGNRREGLSLQFSENNSVISNDFSTNLKSGVYLYRTANNTISENNILSNSLFGVDLRGSNDAVMNNTVAMNGGSGIYVANYGSATISYNNVSLNGKEGIRITWAERTTIVNNTVFSNFESGILAESSNNVFMNNTILSNQNRGILARYCSKNVLIGNVLDGYRGIGITIYRSDNNTVNDNRVSNHWGGGISFSYSRDDTIRGNILKNNSDGISYGGSNSTITNNSVVGNGNGAGLSVGGENITVEDNLADWNSHGISIYCASDCVVNRNNVSFNYVDGINAENGEGNLTLSSNNASLNLRHGIYLGGRGISLTNNTMVKDGIYIRGGNYLSNWNLFTIDTSNTVNGKPVYYWKDCNGGTIPADAGQIILANCTGVLVENQNVSFGTAGILLGLSHNNTIANITSSWNGREGLAAYYSNNNTISNSTLSWNAETGFYLEGITSNAITGCNISNNNDGIWSIRDLIDTTIKDSTILWNSRYGIFSYPASNLAIENNTISGNQYGVFLRNSFAGQMEENTISHNHGYGLYIDHSVGNRIFHNRFVNNSQQAGDWGNTNEWDDGYPSGGNYWDDYKGSDWYFGPNQDKLGSDGIGDSPYTIDFNTQDRYPLLAPFGILLPRPPTLTKAILSGSNLENVTLSWLLSSDDGIGNASVVGYRIFRSQAYDSSGIGYQMVASLPNRTSEYIDISVGEGDSNNYFYRVCSVDSNNNTRCARDQAAKFARYLDSGVNLISTPVVQHDENMSAVLQTLSYTDAWSYDSLNGKWKSFSIQKPYPSQLGSVNHTCSIWVNVDVGSNFTVAGIVPPHTSISLNVGWNLVGYPSFNATYTVAGLKAQTGVPRVEGYDSSASPYFLRVLQDSDVLMTGYGYWVWVDSDTVWTVTNS